MTTFTQLLPRQSDRVTTKIAVVVYVENDHERDGHNGFTLDVSAGGMRIQAGIPLSLGQVVEVAPVNGSDPVTGRVVWVGKPASEMEGQAGLKFLDLFENAA